MTTKARILAQTVSAGNVLADGQVNANDIVGLDISAAEILTKLKTVDGSGSGLDADLLDGQSSAYYLDWTNTTNKPEPQITLAGDLSGSVTLTDFASGTLTSTLATSGVVAGTYGDSTNIPQITIDTKGRVTTVSNVAVSIPSGSLTFTGDVSGTGSTGSSTTLTLASVGTSGTYTKVTTDAKGRVTSGTTLSASDIPNIDASKITTGVLDAARLPSYVDDVLEYVNLAGFPTTGESGKIYVALDTNKTYRWSGSAYVYITSGAVDSVAGKTGVVTLVKGDVGLGSVDNTADSAKNVLSAATLTTARTLTIGNTGKTFNGSANVSWTVAEIGAYPVNGSAPTDLNTAGQGLWRINTGHTNAPTGVDYGTLLSFDNANDTGFQIASDFNSNNLHWRSGNPSLYGGGSSFGAWRELIHDGNYNDYAPTKTGTGASGTWGISISGNAATATNADTLDGQHGAYYQPASTAITTSNIGSQSVNYAASAGAVPWSGVSSKPTTLSGFGITDGLTSSAAASTYAALSGATFTGAVGLSDQQLTRAVLTDCAYNFFDSGTTNALNFVNGSHQRWAPATGAQTLSITNWPPSGELGELLIEGVNLGAATITWPTINWIKADGTTTTTFSSNGVTLQTSGTDWVYLWTRDAGTTIYGKVVR